MSALQHCRDAKLVAVTAPSSILIPSIPLLYKLARYPIVIHISVQPDSDPDYADITSIRDCGFVILQSESLQEAQDMSLTAHALAIRSGKGVIHFFASGSSANDAPIAEEDRTLVASTLALDTSTLEHAISRHERSLYAHDGRVVLHHTMGSSDDQSLQTHQQALLPSTSVHNQSQPASLTTTPSDQSARTSEGRSSSSSVPTSTDSSTEKPVQSDDIESWLNQIWTAIFNATGRSYHAFEATGPKQAANALLLLGTTSSMFTREIQNASPADEYVGTTVITPRLYRPWLAGSLQKLSTQKSISRIAVLEQVKRKTTKWGPLLLDALVALKASAHDGPVIVGHQLAHIEPSTCRQALKGIFHNLLSASPIQNLQIGAMRTPDRPIVTASQPVLENAYTKILHQVFPHRLYIANRLTSHNIGIDPIISASPEFGFGSLIARSEHRLRFIEDMRAAARSSAFTTDVPREWLYRWLLTTDRQQDANDLATDLIARLETDGSEIARRILDNQKLLYAESQWLIGSDAWAYDLGNSGVHHVLASGRNVNMLIIDSSPYSERVAADAARRKKDIGLYAMNFGNAYVASVAVYSSYTQVLEAMTEAEKFKGPSIVLAYLPYDREDDSPLTVLQETKKAVDLGYWPLYRWDPNAEDRGEDNFKLDSERVKDELKEFLRRDNHMTQLMKRQPEFHSSLDQSYGTEVRATQKRVAKDAYGQLMDGLAGAPLTILYASDGGNAETLAKRLANRGKTRGLKIMCMAMDDYPLEDLMHEEHVVLITSTAGQGEFPQNGRVFWDTIRNSVEIDLVSVQFTTFALGDSNYWPRKEDKAYYNKSGKDIHAKFLVLGGKAFVDIGLGDDQDPDGYQTAYAEWEPKLWDAMSVGNVEGLPDEPPPITNEDIKVESNFLRGTIEEGLADPTTAAISAADQQLTKFHGTYMQDDRDLREERKAQGLEPAYTFMIRCRLPGGIATAKQWTQMDALSTNLGNETMKLTTRQTFQFHGVIKGKLKPAMQAINQALMTTIAACGDVNRQVMCSPLPSQSDYHREVFVCSKKISDHLLPSTTAYHEIWLKDKDSKTQVAGDAVQDFEPLYGPTYLPRKFKITIAIPPHNDTDVYAHDVGLIAIKGADGHLEGFNVLAGGGMGVTHGAKKTYPRTGSMLGFCPTELVHIACEKIMLVQKDNGDRKNRKHARLKYTIDDMGLDVFKSKVEELWERKFDEPKEFKFVSNIDTFGWQRDEHGGNHFTMFIENGRIEDTADFAMKTGLNEIAKLDKCEFRLSPNQHLIVSNISDADIPAIKKLLAHYKLDNTNFSALRLSSSACVAFPTCGLAMAESERYLPELISKLESTIEESGLRQDSIVMRMTGCPNGCARPWLAEIGLVGKSYGAYNLYLGGGYHGQRLNKLYRSSVKEEEILEILKPLIKRYAVERNEGERMGDWLIRAGVIKATTEGKTFHDDVSGML